MDDEVLNMSTRKFLRKVGVTSQREIEDAIRDAVAGSALQGNEVLDVRATFTIGGLPNEIVVEGRIQLV